MFAHWRAAAIQDATAYPSGALFTSKASSTQTALTMSHEDRPKTSTRECRSTILLTFEMCLPEMLRTSHYLIARAWPDWLANLIKMVSANSQITSIESLFSNHNDRIIIESDKCDAYSVNKVFISLIYASNFQHIKITVCESDNAMIQNHHGLPNRSGGGDTMHAPYVRGIFGCMELFTFSMPHRY